jgi:hypothetical protein
MKRESRPKLRNPGADLPLFADDFTIGVELTPVKKPHLSP